MKRINDFRARYGPWAVVAGASAGLGAEFATQLAAKGLNLILIARRGELLEALGAQLTAQFDIDARALALDLARADAADIITAETSEKEVGLLVYNAAFSAIGPFLDRTLDDHLREIDTNVRTPLRLAHSLGQRMRARGRGGIILMSSLSATQGSPLISNYAATKAYNLILAEGLWDELRAQGVAVLACCAGATVTPNYAESAPARSFGAMTPRAVVAATLAALGDEPSVIPGRGNQFAAFVLRRWLPRKIAIRLMGRVLRAMYVREGRTR